MIRRRRARAIAGATAAVVALCAMGGGPTVAQTPTPSLTYRLLARNILIDADLWSPRAEILSAGYGFDGIIGVDGGEPEVRAAGGTWNTVQCANGAEPPRNVLTSSSTTQSVIAVFDAPASHADGLPVVFSWPVLAGTVEHTDFRVTLNTGEVVVPSSASVYPNFEFNERHVVVIFGDFGNRLQPGEPGARYATRVEVVDDGSPLLLVGPLGPVSAVGLVKTSDSSPYQSGPFLVGAKLSRLSTRGEGGPRFLSANLPNDGRALYGSQARYRLRILTTGGFSPDGVQGVLPTEFERFFRLHAEGPHGETVLLTRTCVDYQVAGGVVRVVGLADLGLRSQPLRARPGIVYDDCYVEDHDNYIDIVLDGDEAAMRHVTHVEIPATGDYDPFFNPGGPGNNPTPGVRYTAPGPPDLEPVIIALDDPGTVTHVEPSLLDEEPLDGLSPRAATPTPAAVAHSRAGSPRAWRRRGAPARPRGGARRSAIRRADRPR